MYIVYTENNGRNEKRIGLTSAEGDRQLHRVSSKKEGSVGITSHELRRFHGITTFLNEIGIVCVQEIDYTIE